MSQLKLLHAISIVFCVALEPKAPISQVHTCVGGRPGMKALPYSDTFLVQCQWDNGMCLGKLHHCAFHTGEPGTFSQFT